MKKRQTRGKIDQTRKKALEEALRVLAEAEKDERCALVEQAVSRTRHDD